MHRVVLSANVHPDYEFLLPLTAIIWRERTRYTPLCITTSQAMLNLSSLCLDWHLEDFCKDPMGAKLARWYSHKYVAKNDILLLADADAWPIDGAYWGQDSGKAVTCFYGDAFQGRMHCTHGFRATAAALKEIAPGTWQDRLEELWQLPRDDEARYSDDCAQSKLLLRWMEGREQHVELLKRGPSPPANRIDRSRWPEIYNLDGMVDAHLPRECSDMRVWSKIRPLFRMLAPGWADWADSYRDSWERRKQ